MYPQLNSTTGGFINPLPSSSVPSVTHPVESTSLGRDVYSTASTTLRVVIAEKYRLAPPVPSPSNSALSAATPPNGCVFSTLDFAYEKEVLRELDLQSNGPPLLVENGLGQRDKYEALISHCISGGFSREEALLGLSVALATSGQHTDVQMVDKAADKVRHLISMGSSRSMAVGALVAKAGNLEVAVEMLYP